MENFALAGNDTLLACSESFDTEEKVEIYRTAAGRYRVIHTVYTEDFYSGELDYYDFEEVCDNGSQVHNFLLETFPCFFGDLPWYLTSALDEAEARDPRFQY